MRYYFSCFSAVCLVVAASTSIGAQAPSGPGIFGVYDPVTRVFQPTTVQTAPPDSKASEGTRVLVARTGSIRFRLVIRVRSGSPAATLPTCYMSFNHTGIVRSYSEQQSLTGTRTGNNALCDITIPYSWPEANNANGVSLSITVYVGNRYHNENLPPIPLPPDGATPTITVKVTA